MLVWLASYPRSGNGFAREVLYSLYGIRTYSIYEGDRFPISRITKAKTLESQLGEIHHNEKVIIVKTHQLPTESEYPAIYIVRDGRDSMVSYAWFNIYRGSRLRWLQLFGHKPHVRREVFSDILKQQILSQNEANGNWSQNTSAWATRPNTVVIRFEQLIQEPANEISNAIQELHLPFSLNNEYKIPSFDNLQKRAPHLYRRGKIGCWKDEFPTDLQSLFWETHGLAMRMLKYK